MRHPNTRDLDYLAENLHAGILLVVAGDDVPRCHGRAGPGDHLIDGDIVLVPLLAIAVVLRADLVPFERDSLTLLDQRTDS